MKIDLHAACGGMHIKSIELNIYYNVNFDYLSKLKEIYKYRLEPYEVKCEIKSLTFHKCETNSLTF